MRFSCYWTWLKQDAQELLVPESWAQHSAMTDVWSFGVVLFEIYSRGDEPMPEISDEQFADLVRARVHASHEME